MPPLYALVRSSFIGFVPYLKLYYGGVIQNWLDQIKCGIHGCWCVLEGLWFAFFCCLPQAALSC